MNRYQISCPSASGADRYSQLLSRAGYAVELAESKGIWTVTVDYPGSGEDLFREMKERYPDEWEGSLNRSGFSGDLVT